MGRPNERLETRSIYCPRRCATRAPYPRQPSDPDRRVGGTVFESHLRARANFVSIPEWLVGADTALSATPRHCEQIRQLWARLS